MMNDNEVDLNDASEADAATWHAVNVAAAVLDRERLAALRATNLLDSAPEEAFDRLTRVAARILEAPLALVSLIDHDRQFFKSAVGLNEPVASSREMPLAYSFCKHAVATREPLIIEDARVHPLVRDNPAVGENGTLAYAGIPLITSAGHALGTLCVADVVPRSWSEAQIEVLRALSAAVLTEIELRTALREITQHAERERTLQAEGEALRRRQAEAETALRQRAFVRDVLFCVTEGRLRLCDAPADLPPPLCSNAPEAEAMTLESRTLRSFRQRVQEAALAAGLSEQRRWDLITAAGEAAMNAVVHAGGGRARCCADAQAGRVQVWVEDHGKGLALDSLHRATLERGYTTAGTLGHGFWLMLQTADRVDLLTSAAGTTVVLETGRDDPGPFRLRGAAL